MHKRLNAREVIQLEHDNGHRPKSTVNDHAKLFMMAVIVIFLIGAALLMLPVATESNHRTSFIDALFTSVSAFSVTGLTTLETQQHWSFFGELVILLLIQIGGFGFMAGTSVVLITLGRRTSLSANKMMQDGSPAMTLQEASHFSLRIVKFMAIAEAIGAVILTAFFMRSESLLTSIWHGVFHSVSAFCNAGLDLLGHYPSVEAQAEQPVFLIAIATLVQLGALSYMVLSDVWKHRAWQPLSLDSKLVLITNGVLIIVGSALFVGVEWNSSMMDMDSIWKPVNAIFEGVASRTSGFTSTDWGEAHNSSMYLWIVLMLIGGAAGSTAGGVKLATIAVIAMTVMSTVRGRQDSQAFGRRVTAQLVYRALSVIALFMLVHFLLALLLVLTEDLFNHGDFSFLALMFEAMSALATTGLSTGITADLSIGGKAVLMIGMFIGRLGPITVAFALQNRQQHDRFRYAEANIRIG